MVLLTMGTTEILVLVGIGIALVTLIGVGLLRYAKLKMEEEIEEVDSEIEESKEEAISTTPETEEEAEVDEKTEESLSEIELLLQEMQSDLEKQERDPVHTFEEEQEEKAVISYQELKAMKEEPKRSSEVALYEEEQEKFATASVDETIREIAEARKIETTQEEPVQKQKQTFSHSEFISPVYGKMESNEPSYPKIPNFKEEFHIQHNDQELQFDDVTVNLKKENTKSLEDTFKLGPISDDTKNNEEFLKALKDFRNNLE